MIIRALLFFFLMSIYANGKANSLQELPTNTLASPINLKDLAGQFHSLAEYRGKVLLVNFWGSWCSTCIEEMPSLQRLQKKFQHGEFVVLAVNVNQTHTTVQRFLQRQALDLIVLMDTSAKTAESWKVEYYPSSFIIDKSGQLRFYAIGKIDWDQTAIVDVIHRLITE